MIEQEGKCNWCGDHTRVALTTQDKLICPVCQANVVGFTLVEVDESVQSEPERDWDSETQFADEMMEELKSEVLINVRPDEMDRVRQFVEAGKSLMDCNPASISDGSTAAYYELPAGATELQHLISYRNMNGQIAEIFRACYRYGLASHSAPLRDAKKILFYAQAEVDRLTKYGS